MSVKSSRGNLKSKTTHGTQIAQTRDMCNPLKIEKARTEFKRIVEFQVCTRLEARLCRDFNCLFRVAIDRIVDLNECRV